MNKTNFTIQAVNVKDAEKTVFVKYKSSENIPYADLITMTAKHELDLNNIRYISHSCHGCVIKTYSDAGISKLVRIFYLTVYLLLES